MSRARVTLVFACLLLAHVCPVRAEQVSSAAPTASVPRVIRLDGQIAPLNGLPPASVETVTLAIYASPTGGTPLWEETQEVRVDPQGRYTVFAGASTTSGMPATVLAASEGRWLGIRVARPGDVEQPRVPLTSVPYAMRASDADTLGGLPPSAFLRASASDGAVGVDSVPATAGAAATPYVSSGTANFIGKFTSAVDLTSSVLFENGGRIGLGTTSPLDVFHSRFTDTTGSVTGLAVQNLGSGSAAYSGMLFYDQNGALGQFQGFNNGTHEYRINNIASGGSINFMLGGSSKLAIDSAGRVGIGTTSPGVALDVVGFAVASVPGPVAYFLNTSSVLVNAGTTSWGTTLRTSSGIVSGAGYATTSDQRIKRVLGRSAGGADLERLLRIEVTDYSFKDVVEHGAAVQKKVIAQQVESVYPEAVHQTTDVVPDIYQKAPLDHDWIALTTDVKVGERVRLITEDGHRAVYTVLEVREGGFRTDLAAAAGQVFVYGREVSDFRVVDYEAIAMLNVSATQELHRKLQEREAAAAAQAEELAMLKQQVAELRSTLLAGRAEAAGAAATKAPQQR